MAAVTANSTISPVDALWALYRSLPKKLRKEFRQRIKAEDELTIRQKEMVKESLTRALNELEMAQHGGKQLKDAKTLFK